jgi:predicted phosphoribosyltransferase
MRFKNREHAATLLAARLSSYKGQSPLVLGLPRGAVPMAAIIASALGGELDVVLVRKLRAPYPAELMPRHCVRRVRDRRRVDEKGHRYVKVVDDGQHLGEHRRVAIVCRDDDGARGRRRSVSTHMRDELVERNNRMIMVSHLAELPAKGGRAHGHCVRHDRAKTVIDKD